MPSEFTLDRHVEFSETDMAGIVHFSHFFRYMEETEHAFVHSLGFSLHRQERGAMSGFARVHAECDYRAPLRYHDTVAVRLRVERKGTRSLSYRFLFRKIADRGRACAPVEVAVGRMTVVHVTRGAEEDAFEAAELPPELARRLEPAPSEPESE